MLIKAGSDGINPWLNKTTIVNSKRRRVGPASADDRIRELRFYDSSKLRAVIAWHGTQKTVRAKALIFLKRRGIDVNKSGS